MRPTVAALVGGLCVIPFLAANAVVANRIEPFFSWIRPGPHTSGFEYVLLTIVIGCIGVGAFIAGRPLFDRLAPRRPLILVFNGGLSALLLVVFLTLVVTLGSEIYSCDVIGIPNCD